MQPEWLGRNYALYWTGSLAVAIGLWVQRLTVAWLTWEMTGFGVLAGPYCDSGPFTENRAWPVRWFFRGTDKPKKPYAAMPNEQCGPGTHLGELHFGWPFRAILASLFRRSQWPDCRHSTTGSHVTDGSAPLKAANRQSCHFNIDQRTCRAICGTSFSRPYLGIQGGIARLPRRRGALWRDDRCLTFSANWRQMPLFDRMERFPA